MFLPTRNNRMHLAHTVGERGRAGLKNIGGLYLIQLIVQHRRNTAPTGTRAHAFRTKALAAPRANNDIRPAPRHLACVGDDAALGVRKLRVFDEAIRAAGNPDQLRHPADAADKRLIPLLKIDTRVRLPTGGRAANGVEPVFEFSRQRGGARILSILALMKAEILGFSLRAYGGRTVKPEMPTMRSCLPSKYNVSQVSSVRQTIRCGWRADMGDSYCGDKNLFERAAIKMAENFAILAPGTGMLLQFDNAIYIYADGAGARLDCLPGFYPSVEPLSC